MCLLHIIQTRKKCVEDVASASLTFDADRFGSYRRCGVCHRIQEQKEFVYVATLRVVYVATLRVLPECAKKIRARARVCLCVLLYGGKTTILTSAMHDVRTHKNNCYLWGVVQRGDL